MEYILVTGGAGYIGAHTARLLARRGYAPIILDNLSKGHRQAVGPFPFFCADFSDEKILNRIFQQYPIKAVMHFAAFTQVEESTRFPEKYYQNNTENVRKLLEVMTENKIPYFVFSSSAAIFGESQSGFIDENHPIRPVNPYGRSKRLVEEMLEDFEKNCGLKFTALRYFNAAGADESGEIGESHSPETHLIPLILQTAAGKRPQINIFGTDYPTPDGTCIRDYIHVNDLANAHILALKKMEKDNQSEYFNLGNGQGYSVAQLIAAAKKITGIDFQVRPAPRRSG
ncbi:MAG: UDP-glucose 4-epimerase GalE, partial [Elusimicrobiaceae bacterium]|nr:UDP-glucose 4-epimerase GalE [Elusimicrobiaceae bacterium]